MRFSRETKQLLRESFEKYDLPKYKDLLVKKTEGVYRCSSLELDVYPGTQSARFYRTGEKITLETAYSMMDAKLEDRRDQVIDRLAEELVLYENLFDSFLRAEIDSGVNAFIKECLGETPEFRLVFFKEALVDYERLKEFQKEKKNG